MRELAELVPGSAGYDDERRSLNPAVDARPAAIVRAAIVRAASAAGIRAAIGAAITELLSPALSPRAATVELRR